jgi:prepilin-type N-terminal cleavage/methylation domain-containing protein
MASKRMSAYRHHKLISVGRSSGFTLVELLVVMAISSILLGLVFGPLVQGFNLTTRARVQVLTQATARNVLETLKSDISDGVYVYDNTAVPMNAWVKINGVTTLEPMPYAMVDIVPPLHVNDQNPNETIDPTTGLPLESARGPVQKPLAPGTTIIRYWICLRDNTSQNGMPVKPYYNYYDDPSHADLSLNNPMILYRAEVSPYVQYGPNKGKPDERFFKLNAGGSPIIEDPNFFYDDTAAPSGYPPIPGFTANAQGYGTYAQNWKAIAHPVTPIESSDEVMVPRDANGNLLYNQITPLVRFQPTMYAHDAGVPGSTGDVNNEMPSVPASSETLTHGFWTLPATIRVYHNANDVFTWNDDGSGMTTVLHNGADTGWNPVTQTINNISSFNGLLFSVNERKGTVNFAFPDSVINGNQVQTYDPHYDVNNWKNFGWSNYRFINLLWNKQNYTDPTTSPAPLPSTTLSPFGQMVVNNGDVRIVPGSEVVTGPDMRSGPHYGMPIVYTRVNRNTDPMTLGPNEYMINYNNNYSGISSASPNQGYDANRLDIGGTIIFCSQTDTDNMHAQYAIPELGNEITVTYKIQNNRSSDFVDADYLSRQMMQFSLGVKLFDFSSGQPQQITLAQSVAVQDMLR